MVGRSCIVRAWNMNLCGRSTNMCFVFDMYVYVNVCVRMCLYAMCVLCGFQNLDTRCVVVSRRSSILCGRYLFGPGVSMSTLVVQRRGGSNRFQSEFDHGYYNVMHRTHFENDSRNTPKTTDRYDVFVFLFSDTYFNTTRPNRANTKSIPVLN